MFIPPLNMGQFQPSPATMSQWIYQIWQFLQENPIATETEIREFIQSELTQSEALGNAIEEYLTENPPQAPVQSVLGMTGNVQFDARVIDVNSSEGDTTIAEALSNIGAVEALLPVGNYSVNSGELTLSGNYSDYDFLIVRCGFDVSGNSAGGITTWLLPVNTFGALPHFSIFHYDGSGHNLFNITLYFSDSNKFSITSTYNVTTGASVPAQVTVRTITGIKLK